MPLVAEAELGAREHAERRDLDRELAALGADHLPGRPHPVAHTELAELVERLGHVGEGEQLDLAGRVPERGERELALRPHQHGPPRHRDDDAGLLPRAEPSEPFDDLPRVGVVGEGVRLLGHAVPPLRSYTMRSPWSVSHGSTWCTAVVYGATSGESPPVATTVEGPSTEANRAHIPSTCAANP